MMKRAIFILTMVFILPSCWKYTLSKSDLEWQPYRVGDQLIFESSEGESDTLRIESVEINNNADDPLAIFPNIVQSLFVRADNKHTAILRLRTYKGSSIEFTIRLGKNDLRYPGTSLEIEKETIDALEKVVFNGKNSFKIKAEESHENMLEYPFDLRYIYWSKEYGYLGLEFEDNYIWTLRSFIRDGKEIL